MGTTSSHHDVTSSIDCTPVASYSVKGQRRSVHESCLSLLPDRRKRQSTGDSYLRKVTQQCSKNSSRKMIKAREDEREEKEEREKREKKDEREGREGRVGEDGEDGDGGGEVEEDEKESSRCTFSENVFSENFFSCLPLPLVEQCLARCSRSEWPLLRQVCRSWRTIIDSPEILFVRKERSAVEEWLFSVEAVGGEVGRLWAYDPVARQWYGGNKLPAMTGISQASSMAAIGQDIFFFGGATYVQRHWDGRRVGIPVSSLWKFSPVTGTAIQMKSMSVARSGCGSCVLNGKILVAGGTGVGDFPLKSAELYDPESNSWRFLPDLAKPRGRCIAAVLQERVYVFSNTMARSAISCSAEAYDPLLGNWDLIEKALPSDLGGRLSTKFAVTRGQLFLTNHMGQALHELRMYDIRSNSWIVVGTLPVGAFTGYGVVGLNSRLYIEGGSEEFPASLSWWQPSVGSDLSTRKIVRKHQTPYLHTFDPWVQGKDKWELGTPPSEPLHHIARTGYLCTVTSV